MGITCLLVSGKGAITDHPKGILPPNHKNDRLILKRDINHNFNILIIIFCAGEFNYNNAIYGDLFAAEKSA